MTLTASDLYKPAVEKARAAYYATPRNRMEAAILAYLNACLEAGEAKKAHMANVYAGDEDDSPDWFGGTGWRPADGYFPALILRMERKP